VFVGDKKVGFVTSGSPSPMLNKNIGLAYVDEGFNKTGSEIEISIRDKKIKAKIVKTPFLT
jgi:aminomethyltransferase